MSPKPATPNDIRFMVSLDSVQIVPKQAILCFSTDNWEHVASEDYELPAWCKKASFCSTPDPFLVVATIRYRDQILQIPDAEDSCGFAAYEPQCIYRDDEGVYAKFRLRVRLHPCLAPLFDIMIEPSELEFSARPAQRTLEGTQ